VIAKLNFVSRVNFAAQETFLIITNV